MVDILYLLTVIACAEERHKLYSPLSCWKLSNLSVNSSAFFQFVKFSLISDLQRSEVPCLHAGDVSDNV